MMTETFHGYIDTTQDVLLIFEGCRRGLLPKVNRRLHERERRMIQSGSVFVFDEQESGVKRWTDGFLWSPSRILGNFLIYRELDKKQGDKRQRCDMRPRSQSMDMQHRGVKEKRLVGSLSDVYNFRSDGLVKKTMSIVVNGSTQHLISYYHPQDVLDQKLPTPSSVPELACLEISPELLIKQNFRIPPFVEPSHEPASSIHLAYRDPVSYYPPIVDSPYEPVHCYTPTPTHALPDHPPTVSPSPSSSPNPQLGHLLNPIHPLHPTSRVLEEPLSKIDSLYQSPRPFAF
ncbi:hypothetical protein DM01DRAFT_1383936 [Hesseltinella vesiculosa]|uniref:Gti1/Pac2 family-domain-containing protein n=1 Tax=Hesseltinella vesiculosa TaxID=101127 RepID=A0A1X2GFU5_9FUNG|nr:hypothetical protein DM01DRAFT_1383936 [Hesseltinella vesiculosa]